MDSKLLHAESVRRQSDMGWRGVARDRQGESERHGLSIIKASDIVSLG